MYRRVRHPMGPLQALLQSFPGTLVQPVHHLSISVEEEKAQQVSLLSLLEIDRRSVLTLEGEAGRLEKVLGLLQRLKTFGHVPGWVDQVIGIPQPGRIRATLVKAKVVYVVQADIQAGRRVGVALLDARPSVLIGSATQNHL